jgi:glycosyltransferase involved in cell wall biosynthesis
MVLAEAATLGTPIIATNCVSGPAELLEGGKNGYLVPMRDPSALADAMCQLIRSPEEARRKAARAQSFARDLDQMSISNRYFELLAGAASATP